MVNSFVRFQRCGFDRAISSSIGTAAAAGASPSGATFRLHRGFELAVLLADFLDGGEIHVCGQVLAAGIREQIMGYLMLKIGAQRAARPGRRKHFFRPRADWAER